MKEIIRIRRGLNGVLAVIVALLLFVAGCEKQGEQALAGEASSSFTCPDGRIVSSSVDCDRIAWWNFDGNTRDGVGVNHGTIRRQTIPPSVFYISSPNRPQPLDRSLELQVPPDTETNQRGFVAITDTGNLDLEARSDFTITTWFYTADPASWAKPGHLFWQGTPGAQGFGSDNKQEMHLTVMPASTLAFYLGDDEREETLETDYRYTVYLEGTSTPAEVKTVFIDDGGYVRFAADNGESGESFYIRWSSDVEQFETAQETSSTECTSSGDPLFPRVCNTVISQPSDALKLNTNGTLDIVTTFTRRDEGITTTRYRLQDPRAQLWAEDDQLAVKNIYTEMIPANKVLIQTGHTLLPNHWYFAAVTVKNLDDPFLNPIAQDVEISLFVDGPTFFQETFLPSVDFKGARRDRWSTTPFLGGSKDIANQFIGKIGEAAVYDHALSTDELKRLSALCGNDALRGSEACEDRNSIDGDGCSARCELERDYFCMDLMSEHDPYVKPQCFVAKPGTGDVPLVSTFYPVVYDELDRLFKYDVYYEDTNEHFINGLSHTFGRAGEWTVEVRPIDVSATPPKQVGLVSGTIFVKPVCGDGQEEWTEECDDGNLAGDDACSALCEGTYCDDGIQQRPNGEGVVEGCDDGTLNGQPNKCNLACTGVTASVCGNAIRERGEACDDGAANSDSDVDACRTDCSLAGCGDAVQDSGEQCDDGLPDTYYAESSFFGSILARMDDDGSCVVDDDRISFSCMFNVCGDGYRDGRTEQCDWGGLNSNSKANYCRADCTNPRCGDGIKDSGSGEECDVGGLNSDTAPNACRTTCQLPRCGDGAKDTGEGCDRGTGNANSCTATYGASCTYCSLTCTEGAVLGPRCGDASVQTAGADGIVGSIDDETCDSGGNNGVVCTPAYGSSCNYCSAQCKYTTFSAGRCGDGHVTDSEVCDDGTGNGVACIARYGTSCDYCSSMCTTFITVQGEYCGDGIKNGAEGCDEGALNGGPNHCNSLCTGITTPACGNNIKEAGEQCDQPPHFDDAANSCRSDCTSARCGDGVRDSSEDDNGNGVLDTGEDKDGDGVLDLGEQCDDGNIYNSDSCTTRCTIAACGDGILRGYVPRTSSSYEECDDGCGSDGVCDGGDNGDGCDATCRREVCGNSRVQEGEVCDTGLTNTNINLGIRGQASQCTNSCQAFCGDGMMQSGEECDDGGTCYHPSFPNAPRGPCDANTLCSSLSLECWPKQGDGCDQYCRLEICGNGRVEGSEQCDDGNLDDGDACPSSCRPARCLDGFTRTGIAKGQPGYEECDDGNFVMGDGCTIICTNEYCGDGQQDSDGSDNIPGVNSDTGIDDDEQCDKGADNTDIRTYPGVCRTNCRLPGCGDGVRDAGEQCDSGIGPQNLEQDACRSDCLAAHCGDGIMDSGEACDDFNNADGDGCSLLCFIEDDDLDRIVNHLDDCPQDAGNDADGDGYCAVTVGIAVAGMDVDCVDDPMLNTDAAQINPGADDICDGVDNNCDGVADEDNGLCSGGTPYCVSTAAGAECVTCLGDADCSDGLSCNGEEICRSGACFSGSVVTCGAPAFCPTAVGSCYEPSGSCQYEYGDCACDTDADCDDGNSCTADTCTGNVCSNEVISDGTRCDDGQFCTSGDVCSSGLCVGVPVSADDGVDCTDDVCDEGTGVPGGGAAGITHVPDDAICGDGNTCNGAERCDVVLGCQAGAPLVCSDDGNACTTESCTESSGCTSVPLDNDGDGFCPLAADATQKDCDDDATDGGVRFPGATEICENTFDEDCDGTDAACPAVPVCGDRIIDSGAGERCDDGCGSDGVCKPEDDDGDGCSATCQRDVSCGDGLKEGAEECDRADFGAAGSSCFAYGSFAVGEASCTSTCALNLAACQECSADSHCPAAGEVCEENTCLPLVYRSIKQVVTTMSDSTMTIRQKTSFIADITYHLSRYLS